MLICFGKIIKVFYKKLDDEKNFSSFDKELDNFILKHQPQKIILTEPSEYRVLQIFNNYFLSSLRIALAILCEKK
ncbi:MAG: cryptochrome/photolyase family protein, partial [Alphaproteobacteria bacterium]